MNYYSKTRQILEICAQRRVLHIGCVGFADLSTADRIALARQSLHFALSQVSQTTGIDYSRAAIDYFREQGIFDNVMYGNAENLEDAGLTPEFDVIVAGDIIEHISNPGRMLDGVRALCRPDTFVVITTPHAFGLLNFLRHLGGRFVEGREHVFTMNSQNITCLAERHGFEVTELATCYQDHAQGSRLFKLGRTFFERFPNFGGTLFAVLRPRPAIHTRQADKSLQAAESLMV